MTDEDEQLSIPDEPPFPGRSMTGAAQDLSSLFGDEAGADPARTVLRPTRSETDPASDLASQVGELTNKITGLEFGLTDAVERIQAVDRHLATTFQRLQAIIDRTPEEPATSDVAGGLRELGEEVAGAFRGLGERLAALEERLRTTDPEPSRIARVEIAMRSALERLTLLEGRAEVLLSETRSGRQVLDELNGRVGMPGAVPQAVAEPAEAAADEAGSTSSDEPPDDPALDALLGRVLEPEPQPPPEEPREAPREPPPAVPPVEFWSSSTGGGTESTG